MSISKLTFISLYIYTDRIFNVKLWKLPLPNGFKICQLLFIVGLVIYKDVYYLML